ncbi:2Fe-2S iron-sulfur cluster-binding protein [Novosphingobium percolationis]|uniref:2Fe-2S iron-sulfur cluster-binding protein n=1 Tax=Novosphingobium percolationis TaxID=2871811 RepID=UPI001CD20217|nr:pyridoxamine 5'-phosphate oxidase family protein [Novosphingobium percolationis]
MADDAVPQAPIWHEGERAIQAHVGVVERMQEVGSRVIRSFMPDQHRTFYQQLAFVVLGSVDPDGAAWATLVEGQPGFLSSPSPHELALGALPLRNDPALGGIADGAALGLLGIELHTRRRNRVNGTVRMAPDHVPTLVVGQSFGNCPQYIQLRDATYSREPGTPSAACAQHVPSLDERARAMIAAADTFFVASYADSSGNDRQVDVSHRGGKPGFVRVGPDDMLTIPDFSGNLFFSTLGNILLNGRAGLVFVDFQSGDLLQLSGTAQVLLDSPEIAAFADAERLWTFKADQIVMRPGALALRWSFREDGWSPAALATGQWRQRGSWHRLRVERIVEESATIRSFHLQPLAPHPGWQHRAGQHLPIRVFVPGTEQPLVRTYTLSSAPADPLYRISVKRDGLVSSHLHDHLREGDVIEARPPAGGFHIDPQHPRLAVLIGAGVGITPMVSMLRHLMNEGQDGVPARPVVLLQSARSAADRPFAAELADLADKVRSVRVLGDPSGAEAGRDYDVAGRIDLALLSSVLPFGDHDFYLCGPGGFMQAVYDALRGANVPDHRIHAEAFGPSGLQRRPDPGEARTLSAIPSGVAVPVLFDASMKEARWTPGDGSLLELAEARGLDLAFGCRSGSCGSCKVRLVGGTVAYPKTPSAAIGEGEVLLCCAAPAEGSDPVRIEA